METQTLPIKNLESSKIKRTAHDIFQNVMYLTDGGLESTMVFHRGIELNHFAAFELLNDSTGEEELRTYFTPYLDLAVKYDYHFVAETPTWRANPDWAYKLGYSTDELDAINRKSVRFMRSLIQDHSIESDKVLISGNIGPRGDGYVVEKVMTPEEAKAYHSEQIKAFSMEDVDMVSAFTLNYTKEAVGVVLAAREFNVPVVISFTVETDGRLPNGDTLKEAIEKTDSLTNGYTTFFMVNCAHPEHFKKIFSAQDSWIQRIGAIRANASLKSHAELEVSETLDEGDKCLLAGGYYELKRALPNLRVVGGCCGTDHSHIEKICEVLYFDNPEVCSEIV